MVLIVIKYRYDSYYYKIDKVKQDYQNGMYIMMMLKKSNYKMKFIDWLFVEIQNIQIF